MKKYLLYLLLCIAMPALAQMHHPGSSHHQATSLTIVSYPQQTFWLFVDDVLQNQEPVQSICILNLQDKDYHVRVELNNQLHNCFGQYVNLHHSQSLNIVQYNGFYGLDYTQANSRPELVMDLLTATVPPTPQIEQPYMPEGGQILPPITPMPPMEPGMNPKDYETVVRTISNETFDDTRLTIAKQVIIDNNMSSRQIADICKLFTFENNKLEFAKFAYPYCVDPNKYFLLNEVFTYDSSKHELNEFIQKL